MYQRAFAVVSDNTFFPGLWALLNSIAAYHRTEYRVFVAGHHLSSSAVVDLSHHPLGSAITLLDDEEFAYPPVGAWEAKQCVLAQLCGKVATLCLLDADLVLLSRLDDVFERAETGQVVTCNDGDQAIVLDQSFQTYGTKVVGGSVPYFNSGFLCLSLIRHWDLAALWEFTSRFAAYSPSQGKPYGFAGHGDQGVLNALAIQAGKISDLKLLPQSLWCNSAGWSSEETVDIIGRDEASLQVRHRRSGGRQRLLHSSGPKWWTAEGREHFQRSGDVLRCFDHFAEIHPMRSTAREESAARSRSGTLRYSGDISLQDAQILATHAAGAHRILEFGVGGSTHVLCQMAPPGAIVTAVETDPDWIRLTQQNLEELGIRANVEFVLYENWLSLDVGQIDMVFVDGVDRLRRDFAEHSWQFLRVGGVLLVHDTRRSDDVAAVLDLVRCHYLEVEGVEMNARASNITIIRKKICEPYVNWNFVETSNAD